MPFGGVQCAFKTRFPLKGSSGWMGSWARRARAPKELEFGNAFGARARAARPGPLSPRGPLSKENALISTCLTFLLEKPILLHNMQYFWHRASLSKVQYVLKCEILSECFFAPYNRALSFMATQSSFEKAAFVETWITFHWYMYLIYSTNLIQFNPIQSNPDISHLYNPIQSNQTQTNPIQSSPIQSNHIQSNPIYLI